MKSTSFVLIFLFVAGSLAFEQSKMTGSTPSVSAETAAIKTLIERETQSWLNADVNAWKTCWASVPEARLHYSETNGKVHQINMPGGMTKMSAGLKPSKSTFKNTDYLIRVNGNAAFAQFDQAFSDPDGSKEYARETRYLEKMSGAWKIVHVGAMYYTPEKLTAQKR